MKPTFLILALVLAPLWASGAERTVQYNESNLDFIVKPAETRTTGLEVGAATSTPSQASTDYLIKLPPVDGDTGEKEGETDTGKDIRQNTTITIQGVTVRGWDYTKKEEILDAAPEDPSDVATKEDLELFVMSTVEADANMESVSFNFDKIVIHYATSGRLFGIIPLTFTEVVELDTDPTSKTVGRVKVKFPWFRFLLRPDISAGEVEEAAEKGHDKWIALDSWSATDQAEAFASVSNILKTRHDTVKNSISNVR
jgi:hypothetical protein